MFSWAQTTETSATVNLNKQRLAEAVPVSESITSLKLTGTMTIADAKYLRDNFKKLEILDMSETLYEATPKELQDTMSVTLVAP